MTVKVILLGGADAVKEQLGTSAQQFINDHIKTLRDLASSVDGSEILLDIQAYNKDLFSVKSVIRATGVELPRFASYHTYKRSAGIWKLDVGLIEIDKDYQALKLVDKSNSVNVKWLNNLGGNVVTLRANLDVGGYAWLRKGIWPESGKTFFKYRLGDALEKGLVDIDIVEKFLAMDETAMQAFVLTDEFRALKAAFLKSDWHGTGDINAPATFEAFTGAKKTIPSPKTQLSLNLTVNEKHLDERIKHQVFLTQFGDNLRNKVNTILAATETDIADKIRARVAGNIGMDTPGSWDRLQSLLAQIDKIRSGAWGEASTYLNNQLTGLALSEPAMLGQMLVEVSPVVISTVLPTARLLKTIVTSRPFEGLVLKDWSARMQADDLRRIHNAIQLGMVAGDPVDNIVKRVIGTRTLQGADGVIQLSRNQVQSVVRTAVMHISNEAQTEFRKENADLFSQDLFVATLDSRTTPQCRAEDGKCYKHGKGPQPPLHFQCRSLRVPAISAEYMGERPAKPSTEKSLLREFSKWSGIDTVSSRADLPRGMKGAYDDFSRKRIREMTGLVPATTNYQAWLERQTKQFQVDLLGNTKAKLFADGGLKLDQFVNSTGVELTLEQLAKKYPGAFEKAGLKAGAY